MKMTPGSQIVHSAGPCAARGLILQHISTPQQHQCPNIPEGGQTGDNTLHVEHAKRLSSHLCAIPYKPACNPHSTVRDGVESGRATVVVTPIHGPQMPLPLLPITMRTDSYQRQYIMPTVPWHNLRPNRQQCQCCTMPGSLWAFTVECARVALALLQHAIMHRAP